MRPKCYRDFWNCKFISPFWLKKARGQVCLPIQRPRVVLGSRRGLRNGAVLSPVLRVHCLLLIPVFLQGTEIRPASSAERAIGAIRRPAIEAVASDGLPIPTDCPMFGDAIPGAWW